MIQVPCNHKIELAEATVEFYVIEAIGQDVDARIIRIDKSEGSEDVPDRVITNKAWVVLREELEAAGYLK